MKLVASFIDTSQNLHDFDNGTKVMLLIQQHLVQSRSNGGKVTTLKANIPIFTVIGSSKTVCDMAGLMNTYRECIMRKRAVKTRLFQVAPFIADPTNSKGKVIKFSAKVESTIGKTFEVYSHVKKTPREWYAVLTDIHNRPTGTIIDKNGNNDNDDDKDEDQFCRYSLILLQQYIITIVRVLIILYIIRSLVYTSILDRKSITLCTVLYICIYINESYS